MEATKKNSIKILNMLVRVVQEYIQPHTSAISFRSSDPKKTHPILVVATQTPTQSVRIQDKLEQNACSLSGSSAKNYH